MASCYVCCVYDYERKITHRWRKYKTLKLALAHARRNKNAGKMTWIEAGNWNYCHEESK